MKLICVVLAITAGCAFGDEAEDTKCLQEKLTPCVTAIYKGIDLKLATEEEIEPCSVIPDAVKCLSDSIKTCNLKLDVDDLTNTYTEVCKNGTDLNNKLTANEECISKQKDGVSLCVKVKPSDPDSTTQEQIVETQKDVCRQLDSIPPCVAKQIEKECGKDAGEVTQKLISPILKIAQPVCDEILKGAATSLFVSSYSIFFALAVVLFVWMKQ